MTLAKRSLTIAGHRTSIALEPEFWAALDAMASQAGVTVPELVAMLDGAREAESSLSSALRVAALDWARDGLPGTITRENKALEHDRDSI